MKTLFLCILSGALAGCSRFPSSSDNTAKTNLSVLLITFQDLPPGWTTAGLSSPARWSNYMDGDSMEIDFYSDIVPDHNPFAEEIYRSSGFLPTLRSQNNFNYLVKELHSGSIPHDWNFKSQFADNSDFSCYTYSNVSYPACDWIARYDRVVIHVLAWLIPDRMTLSDLENIIGKIDAKAGKASGR